MLDHLDPLHVLGYVGGLRGQQPARADVVAPDQAHGIVTQADCVMWPDAGDPSGVGEFVVENKGLSR